MLGNKIRKANQKAKKRFYGITNPDLRIQIEKQGDTERFFGMYRKTTKGCSCPWCCGNERKNRWNSKKLRLTIQERKAPDIHEWEWWELENDGYVPWWKCPACDCVFWKSDIEGEDYCPACGLP